MEETTQPRAEDLVKETRATLLRRLELVERDHEQLKRRSNAILVGATVALAIALLMFGITLSQGFPGGAREVVEARQFVLSDGAGMVRGVMEITEGGSTRLMFRDGDGRERLKLTLLPDGSPGITLADRDGKARAVLGVLPDQTTNLVFADAQGRTRALFGTGADDATTLLLADHNGATRAALGIDPSGSASFTLFEDQRQAAPSEEAVTGDSAAVTPREGAGAQH